MGEALQETTVPRSTVSPWEGGAPHVLHICPQNAGGPRTDSAACYELYVTALPPPGSPSVIRGLKAQLVKYVWGTD